MSIASLLDRAARLHEKIEELRAQLGTLLAQVRVEMDATPTIDLAVFERSKLGRQMRASVQKNPRRASPLRGRKRAASPSGPLAPAVVKILRGRRMPMSVNDILDGLLASGYKFNAADPRKNLAARIYRLKGVRQVGAGRFAIG